MGLKFFSKCKKCNTQHFSMFLKKTYYICNKCGVYFRLSPSQRIQMLLDKNSFNEIDGSFSSKNILDFPNYSEKLIKAEKSSSKREAITTGFGEIKGNPVAVAVMNPGFMMGSMGFVVGEKITRLVEYAIERRLAVIMITASGGARMQEGIFSLMQMAKTSSVIRKLNEKKLPFFTLLTDPTTGGVSASFAMLGNVIVAEPEALIGFAGPRVIEQTIGQELPEGFQRSEFLMDHGQIDGIVQREEQRLYFARLLEIHSKRFYMGG